MFLKILFLLKFHKLESQYEKQIKIQYELTRLIPVYFSRKNLMLFEWYT